VAAAAATRRWRELYVAAPLGDRAIEGYIDLLYETPTGLVLVDYKTDTVTDRRTPTPRPTGTACRPRRTPSPSR
jgi:ATP-dependent helicase/nuclease subunit A